MNILERVKGLFGISFGGPGASSYDSVRAWELGLPTTDMSGIEYPFAQHPTVSIAISTIAEDAASVGWEMYSEGGDEDDDAIEDHPLLDLWRKPNQFMSGTDLWVASYTVFKLTGECIWYYPGLRLGVNGALRANRRTTGTLDLLDPLSVVVESKNGVVSYKQRVNGQDQPLDLKFLTHFKRFNPYNPLRGLSQMDALSLELNLDWNAAWWNKRFFSDQNGVPTGLLKPATGTILPSQDREEYLKQWNSRHSRKRGIGILPPGWDWEDVGGTPKDMEFGTTREFSREQVLAVFGVPPFMAGVLDKANYANAREQTSNYWNGPITRMLSYFQGCINHDFLPKVGVTGVEAWPDFEKVKALTEDLNAKVDIGTKLFAMGFPKSAINERLDLGMEVDDLEDADIGYLPISMLPVSMVEEAHTPVAPIAGAPNATDGERNEPAAEKAYKSSSVLMRGRRENVWRSISARTRDLESRFERAIRKHFREIEAEVLAQLNALKGWNLVHRVEKAEESSLFDIQYAKGKLVRMTAPLYTAAIDRGGTSVMSEIGAAEAFDKLSPNVSMKLSELTRKIVRIDDTVEKMLRESLVEGLYAGEGVSQLSKRIEGIMDASKSRAATIARTETGSAFNAGRVEGMRQSGVSKQEWLTAHDDHVRGDPNDPSKPNHKRLDYERRALDEAFSNGLRYPCDNSGPPGEVINCRCTVVPVIGENNA